MDYREAINYLYDIETDAVYHITEKEKEAIEVAISVLENSILETQIKIDKKIVEVEKLPKKPIKDKKGNRRAMFKCPRCGNLIAYKIDERFMFSTFLKNNICSCGQEIDWSDERNTIYHVN